MAAGGNGGGRGKGGGANSGSASGSGGGNSAGTGAQGVPSTHPVTGGALPKGTGAGQGRVRRGGRRGR